MLFVTVMLQLILEKEKGKVFKDFIEAKVEFKPTYKYGVGTDTWDSRQVYSLSCPLSYYISSPSLSPFFPPPSPHLANLSTFPPSHKPFPYSFFSSSPSSPPHLLPLSPSSLPMFIFSQVRRIVSQHGVIVSCIARHPPNWYPKAMGATQPCC